MRRVRDSFLAAEGQILMWGRVLLASITRPANVLVTGTSNTQYSPSSTRVPAVSPWKPRVGNYHPVNLVPWAVLHTKTSRKPVSAAPYICT